MYEVQVLLDNGMIRVSYHESLDRAIRTGEIELLSLDAVEASIFSCRMGEIIWRKSALD